MARNLKVEAVLAADTGAYIAGLRRALTATDRFGKSTKKAGRADPFSGLAKNALRAAAATASLYTVYDQGKKAVNTTLDLAKSTKALTRTTGLSTQEASRFIAVAKVRGIETTKLAASFTILSKQIVAAQQGSAKTTAAFKQLGVSQEAIKKGDTKQVFMEAADGLSKMANGANKTALAAQLFGRGYQALFPLLDTGSKGIAKQLQLAGDLGAELSGKGQASVLKFAEAQRKAKLAQIGLQVQIGQVLIPLLTKGVGALSDFIQQFRKGSGSAGKLRSTLEGISAVLKPLAKLLADHPALLAGAAAAWIAFNATVKAVSLFNAISSSFGSIGAFVKLGVTRGIALGAGLEAGVVIGMVALPIILPALVALALERAGAVFQQWATRNMGPELKKALGIPLTLNPFANFGPWFENIKKMAKGAWDFIKRIFSGNPLGANPFGKMSQWWDTIKKGAKGAWDFIKKLFGGGGSSNILGTIRAPKITGLSGIASAVKSAVSSAVKAALSFAGQFLDTGKELARNIAKGAKSAAASVASAAASLMSKAYARARGLLSQFFGIGQSVGSQIAGGIRSAIGEAVQAARDIIQKAKEAAESAKGGGGGAKGSSAPARGSYQGIVRSSGVQSGAPISSFAFQPEANLLQNQRKLEQLQAAYEKAKSDFGDKRSKAESRWLRTVNSQIQATKRAVTGFENAISRRDALAGIQDQFKGFVDQAVSNFREALKSAAQNDLNSALARLDEATGDSPQAQRLRALRAEQERLAREREDTTYRTSRAELEAQLARAVANGNVRSQAELNAQLAALDQDRTDVERQREIDALSSSLQAQRDSAQSVYDARVAAADDANNADVAIFQAGLNAKLAEQFKFLADSTIAYAMFAQSVNKILSDYGLSGLLSTSGSDELAIMSPQGAAISLPKKPKKGKKKGRASGGMLSRSGLTLVGETGPELISGGNVYSATRTARMNGAGVTLNVYPQTTADDPVALARALGWQLATR